MKFATIGLLLIFFATFSNASFAARYWVATVSSNWNNTANWSNASGGAGGFSVPGSADDVNFDGLGLGSCTIDATVNVKSITVTAAYSGTITQGVNSISTVNAASFSGGVFSGGSANFTVGGNFTLAGTAFTSTSAVLEMDNLTVAFTSGTFLHNNGTVRFNCANGQTISGTSPTFYNLEFVGAGNTYTISSAGDFTVINSMNLTGAAFYDINTGIIDVQGDINSTNTNTGCGGTAQININGTGTQNFNGNATTAGVGALPQLNINKTTGTLNLNNFPAVANNFTYTAGTVNAGTSTFCFTRGSVNNYTITGSLTLNNISFAITNAVTATIASGTTLTTTGNLTMAGSGDLTINTGNINVNGNIILTNTGGGGGSGTINIIGSGSQTMDGTAILVNQSRLPIVNINKSSGTLSLLGNISFSANVIYTTGTINPGTAICYIVNNLTITGTFSLYNLTIMAAGNTSLTIAAGSTLNVTNTLDIESTNKNVNINTGTIAVQGNIIDNNTGVNGGGSAVILINGTGAQSITSSAAAGQGRLPFVQIQQASGTLALNGIISMYRDWTYVSGTVNPTTSTVVFGGNTINVTSAGMSFYNVAVPSNTINLLSSLTVSNNLTISGTGILAPGSNTINVAGNWSNYGTAGFTEATSTVNFNGSTLQTITCPGGENFTNMVANNSGTGIQLINNVTVATLLNMTQGNIDLNGNNLTLGLSAGTNGTLTYSGGNIINTGSFIRWFKTATTIADGAVAGLFPLGTASNSRPLVIAAPVTAPTTGGTIQVSYTYSNNDAIVSITDGLSTVLQLNDSYWSVSTSNGLAGGLYDLQGAGTGFGSIGAVSDLRLTLAASVVGTAGTNAGTVTNPSVNRTGLSLANLSNSFYMGSTSPGDILPVDLISFNAVPANGEVKLNWEASSESNNDYFTVQRSKDAMNWDAVIQVAGSTTSSYSAYDQSPYPGISYYRLMQTDIDGKMTYSSTVVVTMENSSSKFTIYPNPATDHVTVSFPVFGKYVVKVLSSSGQVVVAPVDVRGIQLALNFEDLRQGLYYIIIKSENVQELRKIEIIR